MPDYLQAARSPQGAVAQPTGSILAPAVRQPQGPSKLQQIIGALDKFREPILQEVARKMQEDVAQETRIAAAQPLDTEEDAKRLAQMVREGSVELGANPIVRDANRKYQYIRLADRMRNDMYQAYNTGDPGSPGRYTPKNDDPDVAMRWARGFVSAQMEELGLDPNDPDVVAALGPRLEHHFEKFQAYHTNIYTGIQAAKIRDNMATDFRDANDEADEMLLGGMPADKVQEGLTAYLESIDQEARRLGIPPNEAMMMQVEQTGQAIMQSAQRGDANWRTMLNAVRNSRTTGGVTLGRNAPTRTALEQIEAAANSAYIRSQKVNDAEAERMADERMKAHRQYAYGMIADGTLTSAEREAIFNTLDADVQNGAISPLDAQSLQKFIDDTLSQRQDIIGESQMLSSAQEQELLNRALTGNMSEYEFMAMGKHMSGDARQGISQALAQSRNTTVNAASHELSLATTEFRRLIADMEPWDVALGTDLETIIGEYNMFANRTYQEAVNSSADLPPRERMEYLQKTIDRIRDYGKSLLPDNAEFGDTARDVQRMQTEAQQGEIAREAAVRRSAAILESGEATARDERARRTQEQQAAQEIQADEDVSEQQRVIQRALPAIKDLRGAQPTAFTNEALQRVHSAVKSKGYEEMGQALFDDGFSAYAAYVNTVRDMMRGNDLAAVQEGSDPSISSMGLPDTGPEGRQVVIRGDKASNFLGMIQELSGKSIEIWPDGLRADGDLQERLNYSVKFTPGNGLLEEPEMVITNHTAFFDLMADILSRNLPESPENA